jgi:hypothetical protein
MTSTMSVRKKSKMNTKVKSSSYYLWVLVLTFICSEAVQAQNQIYQSQNFRLGEAHYRVAEATQLADTVLVWGDVQLPGTYLVPRNITLAQMLAYARGPINLRTGETDLDWSKVFVEVTVTNRYSGESKELILRVDGSVGSEFFENRIENFDTIILRVRRKPMFLDYVRAYAPIVATVLNSLLLYRTIRDL